MSIARWNLKKVRTAKRYGKLTVNEHKSAVVHMSKRKFLGYSMTVDKMPRLKPVKVSVKKR